MCCRFCVHVKECIETDFFFDQHCCGDCQFMEKNTAECKRTNNKWYDSLEPLVDVVAAFKAEGVDVLPKVP